MLSTFGTLNGSLLTAPRIFFAMADDGLFFRPVAKVHPTFGRPYVAIALTAALGIVFVLLRTFEQLADAFVTAIVPFYALGVASIFVLRKRGTTTHLPCAALSGRSRCSSSSPSAALGCRRMQPCDAGPPSRAIS